MQCTPVLADKIFMLKKINRKSCFLRYKINKGLDLKILIFVGSVNIRVMARPSRVFF